MATTVNTTKLGQVDEALGLALVVRGGGGRDEAPERHAREVRAEAGHGERAGACRD